MSAPSLLMKVRGAPITWDGSAIRYTGGMTIDADGSPRAYHPLDDPGLDDLENAGSPGRWWGIVTTAKGAPIVQGASDPCPGFYVSTTSYMHRGQPRTSPAAYLNSEEVPFVVIPSTLRKMVKPRFIGCLARVTYRGRSVTAVVADIGPATHLGEASIACARALGINADARRGGVNIGVAYEIWPGRPAVVNGVKYELQ